MSSSTKSFVGCEEKTDDVGRAEESGWTSYLQDFSLNSSSYNYGRSAFNSYRGDYSSFGGPSLHSDAASPAAWKERGGGADDRDGGNNVACSSMGVFKGLKNLKKSKKKISDPDLEDTASSPVNSPKVTVLKPAEINQKKIKEHNFGNYSNRVMKLSRSMQMDESERFQIKP